jgi:predicted helicase
LFCLAPLEALRLRAFLGIETASGKQKIIIELYEKFFKSTFPKTVEQLGIVYTPVEIIDFILNSVAIFQNRERLQNVFGSGSRTPIAITLLVKKPRE